MKDWKAIAPIKAIPCSSTGEKSSTGPATIAAWTLLLTSLLYYAYLTYIEIWELEAICQWCVISSIAALIMFILESVQLKREMQAD